MECPTCDHNPRFRNVMFAANGCVACDLEKECKKNETLQMQLDMCHKQMGHVRKYVMRSIVEWMIENQYHGCVTGDCPHDTKYQCFDSLLEQWAKERMNPLRKE